MDATCEEIRMGAGVDVTCIYIYVNTSWIWSTVVDVDRGDIKVQGKETMDIDWGDIII
jgi:hypothetical protein